jgi:phage terminase large subunit
MTEIKIALQPKQRAFREAIDRVPVTFYGGAKGGGKSHGLRSIFLLRRFEYPGTDGAIFRRTFPELEANHIRPLFKDFPSLRDYWNDSKKLLSLPNGSTLQFCYCAREADVDLYQGREFDDLGIEEAGQWTETMITRLRGSNRTSKRGVKPRTALTGNPGGVGHGYLKRLFVDRKYKDGERPEDYAFIQATVDDNAALMENDPDYVRRLDAEPNAALRRAFRHGDWDIFAGQFFQEISREIHVVPAFEIPGHWERFGAYDYGFNHPAAFGWFANDEDGNTYLYRVHAKSQQRVDQFAAHLNKFQDTAKLYPIVGGRDCWTNKSTLRDEAKPPTVADQFKSAGILLKPAVIDRVQGAAHLRSYLAWRKKGQEGQDGKPRLYVFDSCQIAFDCLARMIHDPDNVEDVLKVDATDGDPETGDDLYDMIRYGLMTRPKISDPLPPTPKWGTNEWAKRESDRMEQAAQDHFQALEDQAQGREWSGW